MSAFGDYDFFDAFEEDNCVKEFEKKRKAEEFDESFQKKRVKTISNHKNQSFEFLPKNKNFFDNEVNETTSLLKDVPQVCFKSLKPLNSTCSHEVVYLKSDKNEPVLKERTGEPAKKYKFQLDAFQQESVNCIDNNQSVLVSAHTSAGKTSVAEYAIATSFRKKQRVIYTSPIKALSNQKYRDLQEEFKDVGLMTGDVTINQAASCLVMTTEILRSMLYKGSEIMREVGWVVFDEIHYMRDKTRGVVWEETIILLPDNVRYVFLSATIPNARQLASWVCYLHHQPVHVVYTSTRPVPLEHYIFPVGASDLHKVVDKSGNFMEQKFNSAMAIINDGNENNNRKEPIYRQRRAGNQRKALSACQQVIDIIKRKKYLPAIVFSFSKKDCESYAKSISKIRFNDAKEESLVEQIFNNAMNQIGKEEQELPQIKQIVPLLKRGIGIHHGGLLPIVKETTEILFSEGLIKVLFATETFAMGVNMPAHTVVFTSLRKFDGTNFRTVTGGEFIQMSGRAGRRGKDENGIVIMMVDEKLTPTVGKELVKGSSDPLESAFRLTYNMVLNLLRVEDINPEFMLEKSFFQFQHYDAMPKMVKNLESLLSEWKSIEVTDEDLTEEYYKLRQQIEKLRKEKISLCMTPKYCKPFLQSGRLVTVKRGTDDFGLGIVVGYKEIQPIDDFNSQNNVYNENEKHPMIVDVLLNCNKDTIRPYTNSGCNPRPAHTAEKPDKTELVVVPVTLPIITSISSLRLPIVEDLSLQNRKVILKNIEKLKKKSSEIPLLDPVKDMKVDKFELESITSKIKTIEKRMLNHPLHLNENLEKNIKLIDKKTILLQQIKEAKKEMKKKKKIFQFEELKSRKRILRRLEYATTSDVIETKGRVACEISTGDELMLTELLFDGVFNDLSTEQCCALLSCFVNEENNKSKAIPKLIEVLEAPLQKIKMTANRIAKISVESKLDINSETYSESFKTNLLDVVFGWACKKSFAEILYISETYEGSVIRCIRRLEELLREMCSAAKVMGNNQLEVKFSHGIELIKRDIVFAASLYI